MPELTTPDAIRALLQTHHTIAVLGASADPTRPAYTVPAYLAAAGYRVLPVNPAQAGATLHGERVVARLAELDTPVDLVDVFRRPDQLPAHLPELLALRPRAVWLQLGIRHDAVAAALVEAGIDVVQDRCTKIEHARLIGPPVAR